MIIPSNTTQHIQYIKLYIYTTYQYKWVTAATPNGMIWYGWLWPKIIDCQHVMVSDVKSDMARHMWVQRGTPIFAWEINQLNQNSKSLKTPHVPHENGRNMGVNPGLGLRPSSKDHWCRRKRPAAYRHHPMRNTHRPFAMLKTCGLPRKHWGLYGFIIIGFSTFRRNMAGLSWLGFADSMREWTPYIFLPRIPSNPTIQISKS